MIIIPYSTDVHDGKIRLAALEIIGICLLVHLFVSVDARRTEARVTQAVQQWQMEHVFKKSDNENNPLSRILEMLKGFKNPAESPMMQSLEERIDAIRRQSLMYRLGLTGTDFRLHALFTSMFTHAGWLHLIGNMIMFYVVGIAMEQYWGYWRFLIIYLLCGLAADAAFIGLAIVFTGHPDSAPLVGASGAIAGMMGAFLVTHARVKVKLFYALGFWARGVFTLPAYLYFGFWFLEQIVSVFIHHGHGSGVAYTAHIGGFVAGGLLGMLIRSEDAASIVNHALACPQRGRDLRSGNDPFPKGFYHQPVPHGTRPDHSDTTADTSEFPTGISSETAGWEALGRGEADTARRYLVNALNSYFQAPAEYRLRIIDLMGKMVKERNGLLIAQNEWYQWGKRLEAIKEYRFAIAGFDLAALTGENTFIRNNSLLAAAALRIKTGQQLDRVRHDMEFLISEDSGGIAGNRAAELLASMEYRTWG